MTKQTLLLRVAHIPYIGGVFSVRCKYKEINDITAGWSVLMTPLFGWFPFF